MAGLKDAAVAKIHEVCDSYAKERTPLIMILSDIQNEFGYIPVEVQEEVADYLGISVPEVHGVVTFYSLFTQEPKGKYVIGCCLGTACYVKGAQQVIDQFCEILGIEPGQTTDDGMFTIDDLRCLGACAAAPAVTINGKIYSRVKVNEVAGIIAEYRKKGEEA